MHLVTYLHPRLPTDSAEEPEILAQRLNARARETEAEAAKRLKRAALPVQAKELILFDNSAPLAESVSRFFILLEELLNKP